jgi:hypothetical protein
MSNETQVRSSSEVFELMIKQEWYYISVMKINVEDFKDVLSDYLMDIIADDHVSKPDSYILFGLRNRMIDHIRRDVAMRKHIVSECSLMSDDCDVSIIENVGSCKVPYLEIEFEDDLTTLPTVEQAICYLIDNPQVANLDGAMNQYAIWRNIREKLISVGMLSGHRDRRWNTAVHNIRSFLYDRRKAVEGSCFS